MADKRYSFSNSITPYTPYNVMHRQNVCVCVCFFSLACSLARLPACSNMIVHVVCHSKLSFSFCECVQCYYYDYNSINMYECVVVVMVLLLLLLFVCLIVCLFKNGLVVRTPNKKLVALLKSNSKIRNSEIYYDNILYFNYDVA